MQSLFIGLLTTLMFSIPSVARVYKITDNSAKETHPKILIDQQNRVWCFWREEPAGILSRYLESNQLSVPIQIDTTRHKDVYSSYYDVDIDTHQQLWLAKTLSVDSLYLYKSNQSNWILSHIFVPNYFDTLTYCDFRRLHEPTIAVLDSSRIFLNTFKAYANACVLLNIFYQSQEYYISSFLSDGGIWQYHDVEPLNTIKTDDYIYFGIKWRTYYLSHVREEFVYDKISRIAKDSILTSFDQLTEYSVMENAEYWAAYEKALMGYDSDGYLYYFLDNRFFGDPGSGYPPDTLKMKLQIFSVDDTTSIFTSRIKWFPTAVSENGHFLAMGKINKNNQIQIKAVDDTTFFETTTIPEDSLLGDIERENLAVYAGDFPNIWCIWSGKDLNGNYDVYLANFDVSTIVDNDNIVGLSNSPNNLSIPKEFILYQNYPNPFNPITSIRYELFESGEIKLTIFDITGKEVIELISDKQNIGFHEVKWGGKDATGNNVASGIYFYKLNVNNLSRTQKMILLR